MKMLSTPSKQMMSTDDEHCSNGSVTDESVDHSPCSSPIKSTTTFSASSNETPTNSKKSSSEGPLYRDPLCPAWSQFTNAVHTMIRRFVVALSVHAARNPIRYVVAITLASFCMLAVGFFTNFRVETSYDIVYAPYGSRPTKHMEWINSPETGFPEGHVPLTMLLHNQGSNVMTKQGVKQLFQVLEVVENTQGYKEICAQSGFAMQYPNGTQVEDMCNILGVTRFWYYNQDLFEEQVTTDEDVVQSISNATYPDGVPVNRDFILGQYQVVADEDDNNIITFSKAFQETALLPDAENVIDFEVAVTENLLELQQQWRDAAAREEADGVEPQDRTMQLEFFSANSYPTEFMKAIFKDLPLTFMVGVIMFCFTFVVFFRRDRVQSRSGLGMCAVFSIAMSLAMGHGIMFSAGVPFTNMTMMLPFVLFGVGLDDTFIIMGAYFRTDPTTDTVERIRETMEEVGNSISLTTITTCLAFALGYVSSIPAIQWLCLYSFLSIALVFLFQITLFVGCIVLDERRVKANRQDICLCIKAKQEDEATEDEEPRVTIDPGLRFMVWYADFLMRPTVKVIVLAGFLAYLGFCVYTTTLLTQEFIISDFLPENSYVGEYLDSIDLYASEMVPLGVYFRDIDQSNETVQQEMRDYIDDLMSLEQLDMPPPFCWVRDLVGNDEMFSEALGFDISYLSFDQKLDLALSDSRIQEIYGSDIVRDEQGNITASRCIIYLRNVDFDVVQSQIAMLNDQRAVSAAQPLNEGQENFRMFTFADLYFLWEFYSVAVDELTTTTIAGVTSVTLIAFLLMPHWTAVCYVLPIICMLYIDLLGTLQFCGLHINAVTYVCLTISIGLLVDFLMHVLLRYYESKETAREEKVKDTLKTMGVSILVGGLSTFLAVIPLAFSTSAIITTVFTSFFAMVTLGVAHGLIFLPVVLSFVGPTHTPRLHSSPVDTPVFDTKDTKLDAGFNVPTHSWDGEEEIVTIIEV